MDQLPPLSDRTLNFDQDQQASMLKIQESFQKLLEFAKEREICLHMQTFIWDEEHTTTTGDYAACLFHESDMFASIIGIIDAAKQHIEAQGLTDKMPHAFNMLGELEKTFNNCVAMYTADAQEGAKPQ